MNERPNRPPGWDDNPSSWRQRLPIVACWEVTRGLRWVNLGVWLLAAPWLFGYGGWISVINDSRSGIMIALLSFVPGRRSNRYGGGWSELWS